MPPEMVEIDKDTLTLLQRGYGMLDNLFKDPTHGRAVRAALREKYPENKFTGPEDIAAPFMAEVDTKLAPVSDALTKLGERLESIDKRFQADDENKQTASLLGEIDAACKKFALTDEGREKMIARMKERNSGDAEAAAAWVYQSLPRAQPTGHSAGLLPQTANLFGAGERSDDKNLELLHTNPDKWQQNELNSILTEIDQGTFNAAA